ncbi:restriction endonuclease subunit S [Methyloversatilis sp.]|uniref:restriction endonuclease subunit S n=1 Tax=Methyloversatilis sp. TaxID=2569862 RepID=UPI0035B3BA34
MSDGTPLPAGWTWASLGELLIGIEAGKSFKCQERPPHAYEVGVVKVSAVTWGEYQELESKTCTDTEMVNPALFIQAGDLLFSRANTIELVGACVIARHVTLPLMLSDKILRLKLARDSMKRWVLYLLRSDQGRRQIEALSSGNQESMRNIGQERIAQIRVPLPPFAEQTRVVEKLEELLSDLDAGVVELKAAQKKLALYRQSLLKAAVEGALTADWRARRAARGEALETGAELLARILIERRARWEARQLAKFKEQGKTPPKGWQAKYPEPIQPDTSRLPTLPSGWTWATIDQLAVVVRGASPRPAGDPRYFGGSIPWITVGSLTCDDGIYLDEVDLFVTEAGKSASRYIEPNTLLLTNSGATLGVPKITRIGGCINDGSVALLDLATEVQLYLYFFLTTQTAKLRALNQGAAQPNLNTDIVRRIVVPVCPDAEMRAITEKLTQATLDVKIQDRNIFQALRQSNAQRKNLLKAAFSGQLVPQDPNDEPASALLARIRAERAASGHNTRRQRQKQETP